MRGYGNTTAEISQFLINCGFSIQDTGLMRIAGLNGMCIAEALQPKIQWLMSLGLTRHRIAKAVARFPTLLGFSIEQNLQPKVQWLMTLGLSKGQVASAIVVKPQLLGYSLEKNLKPKYVFLRHSFGVPDTASLIAKRPTVLGYSMLRVAKRMNILARHNLTAKLATYISLTEARFRKRFGD